MGERVERDHETEVLEAYDQRLGRIALFEDLMGYVDTGDCTFDEAIEQYKHDLEVGDGRA